MAEAVGFEPTGRSSRPTVFKTVALNRSATPPYVSVFTETLPSVFHNKVGLFSLIRWPMVPHKHLIPLG